MIFRFITICNDLLFPLKFFEAHPLAPVVRRVDNTIQRINCFPVDVDRDLSVG